MWEKHLKKTEYLREAPVYLLKISLWDISQFLFVQIKHLPSVTGASTPVGLFQTINGLKD